MRAAPGRNCRVSVLGKAPMPGSVLQKQAVTCGVGARCLHGRKWLAILGSLSLEVFRIVKDKQIESTYQKSMSVIAANLLHYHICCSSLGSENTYVKDSSCRVDSEVDVGPFPTS